MNNLEREDQDLFEDSVPTTAGEGEESVSRDTNLPKI
jgi:hypothetical protein